MYLPTIFSLILSSKFVLATTKLQHNADQEHSRANKAFTIAGCTFSVEAQEGDTCASISSYWGIDETVFIQNNPSVGSDCSHLVVGQSYCIQEDDGKAPSPTSSTTTSTSKAPATSTEPSVPAPTQSGLIKTCSRFYMVKSGDYCAKIVDTYKTFTLQDFYTWNPSVHDDCSGLQAGYFVCVGVPGTPTAAPTSSPSPTGPSPVQSGISSDCKRYYKVQSGDYCQKIVDNYGTFSINDFYSWNPAVGSSCENLWVGYFVCVGVSGTPTTKPSAPSPTGPSPTQSGIRSDCTRYYKAASGDSCAAIASKSGTFSVTEFESWNPAVGLDCSALFLGYYYCVGVPGTPTQRPSSPSPTAHGPQPQQAGIVSNCNRYYKVASGDSCYTIEQQVGVSADQFFSWNTGINRDCTNLFLGYYVCIGVA